MKKIILVLNFISTLSIFGTNNQEDFKKIKELGYTEEFVKNVIYNYVGPYNNFKQKLYAQLGWSQENPYRRDEIYESIKNNDFKKAASIIDNSEGTLEYAVQYDMIKDIKFDRIKVLKFFLQIGANPNQKYTGEDTRYFGVYTENHTPLIDSCQSGSNLIDLTKLLLEYGASVNTQNSRGTHPLIGLVEFHGEKSGSDDRIHNFELLLNYGANVNAANRRKVTLLMQACRYHNHPQPKLVKLLLKHGADINITNWRGETALNLTMSPEIFNLLNYIEQLENEELSLDEFNQLDKELRSIIAQRIATLFVKDTHSLNDYRKNILSQLSKEEKIETLNFITQKQFKVLYTDLYKINKLKDILMGSNYIHKPLANLLGLANGYSSNRDKLKNKALEYADSDKGSQALAKRAAYINYIVSGSMNNKQEINNSFVSWILSFFKENNNPENNTTETTNMPIDVVSNIVSYLNLKKDINFN